MYNKIEIDFTLAMAEAIISKIPFSAIQLDGKPVRITINAKN